MYDNKITDFLKENYKISEDVIKMAETAENDLKEMFAEADRITEYNQYKVLNAMQKNKLSDVHFAGTTGYTMTWEETFWNRYMRTFSMRRQVL